MSKRIHLYGTALYDELVGKYRMWYFGRMRPHWRVPHGNYQIPGLYVPRTDERPYHCNGVTADGYGRAFVDNDRGDLTLYAESDDGINWVKPSLGIFTFDGSRDNNIIWDLHVALPSLSTARRRTLTIATRRSASVGAVAASSCSPRPTASTGMTATISTRWCGAATRAPST